MPIYYFLLILLHVAARACMQVVIGIHTMELIIGCNIIDLSDSRYVLYFFSYGIPTMELVVQNVFLLLSD